MRGINQITQRCVKLHKDVSIEKASKIDKKDELQNNFF